MIVDKFHCELDSLISEPPQDAQGLAEGIVTAAKASCTELVPESGDGRSRGLRELLAARNVALDPEIRKLRTNGIWSYQKSERKMREANKLDELLEAGKGS